MYAKNEKQIYFDLMFIKVHVFGLKTSSQLPYDMLIIFIYKRDLVDCIS